LVFRQKLQTRMPLKRTLTTAVLGALCLAAPSAASAQIFAWRDAAGNLVLSDKPKDPATKSYTVATSTATGGEYRTTRPVVSRRAELYDALIEQESAANDVDPNLVRAVIQAESAFNPWAKSRKGAMGLMQLMPATARDFGVRDPYNPIENIRAGVAYLKQLLVRFANNVELALAAYNAGPKAVERYGTKVPPYRETRNYVAKIRSATAGIVESSAAPATPIYRTIEIVDGRPVVKYSGKPSAGAEVVKSATRR
jgi:soluble lytic murein transglycosylase-like protein